MLHIQRSLHGRKDRQKHTNHVISFRFMMPL